MKTKVLSLLMLCVLAEGAIAVEPITLKLWPDGPPTAMVPKSDATVKLIQSYGDGGPNRITDVSDPTITVFRPEKPNGTSVIVAPGGAASSPVADKPALPETVDLLDGADSAEGALTAFVAASKAADDQAALLMVDPPIRRLLLPEIAIEKFAMDSVLIEHALFGEEKNAVGGILFYYAQRDLINIQGAKIINTRNIDDDRVIFTIDSTALSYDHDGTNRTVEEIMAIRRLGKWHVFKPFGIMTMAFLNVASYQIETGPLLKEKRGTTESPNRLNADFELQFAVPFESVHAELVRCSESPETAECILLANRLERLKDSIVNRAKRGNYKTREDLKHAFGQADSFAEEIVTKQAEAFQPLLKNLTKEHLIKSENPANK